jgi:hypothetical protein
MLGHTPEHSGDQSMVTRDDKGYNNHRFMDIDLYLKRLKFTFHILKGVNTAMIMLREKDVSCTIGIFIVYTSIF